MRQVLFAFFTAGTLLTCGCAHEKPCLHGTCAAAPETCQGCSYADIDGAQGCEPCKRCLGAGQVQSAAFEPGPATGAITYPYYTTRGPRDFLARTPPTIGP